MVGARLPKDVDETYKALLSNPTDFFGETMSSVSVVSFLFVLSLQLSLSCLIPASLADSKPHYRLG